MSEKRLNEIAADIEGIPRIRCPKCKSRNVTTDIELNEERFPMGPNWRRCVNCDTLFLKPRDEEE